MKRRNSSRIASHLERVAQHLDKWEQQISPRRIAMIRRSYRLDRKEFAQRIGTTERQLANWETGTSSPHRTQKRLLVMLWKGTSPRSRRADRQMLMDFLARLGELKTGKRDSLVLELA